MAILDALAFFLFCKTPSAWTNNRILCRLLPAAGRWAYRNEPPIESYGDESEAPF